MNAKAAQPKPFVQAALLCEKVLTEQDSVNSYIRVFGRVMVAGSGPEAPETIPPSPLSIQVVLSLGSEIAGAGEVRVVLVLPDGKRRDPKARALPVTFPGGDAIVNLLLDAQFVVNAPGTHWFQVYFGRRLLSRIPLTVAYQRD
jgi:hypothetical protein